MQSKRSVPVGAKHDAPKRSPLKVQQDVITKSTASTPKPSHPRRTLTIADIRALGWLLMIRVVPKRSGEMEELAQLYMKTRKRAHLCILQIFNKHRGELAALLTLDRYSFSCTPSLAGPEQMLETMEAAYHGRQAPTGTCTIISNTNDRRSSMFLADPVPEEALVPGLKALSRVAHVSAFLAVPVDYDYLKTDYNEDCTVSPTAFLDNGIRLLTKAKGGTTIPVPGSRNAAREHASLPPSNGADSAPVSFGCTEVVQTAAVAQFAVCVDTNPQSISHVGQPATMSCQMASSNWNVGFPNTNPFTKPGQGNQVVRWTNVLLDL